MATLTRRVGRRSSFLAFLAQELAPEEGRGLAVARIVAACTITVAIAMVFRIPLAAYMRKVMFPLTPAKRRVVLYDQLNPAYAKYYTRQEARDLIARAGFVDVRMHHRHGMSWTVVGTKPA